MAVRFAWLPIALGCLLGALVLAFNQGGGSSTRSGDFDRAPLDPTPPPYLHGSGPGPEKNPAVEPAVRDPDDSVVFRLTTERDGKPVEGVKLLLMDYRDPDVRTSSTSDRSGEARFGADLAGRLCRVQLDSGTYVLAGDDILVPEARNDLEVRAGCRVLLSSAAIESDVVGLECEFALDGIVRTTLIDGATTRLCVAAGGLLRLLRIGPHGIDPRDAAHALPTTGDVTLTAKLQDLSTIPLLALSLPPTRSPSLHVKLHLYTKRRVLELPQESVHGDRVHFRVPAGDFTYLATTLHYSATGAVTIRRGDSSVELEPDWQPLTEVVAYADRTPVLAADLYLHPIFAGRSPPPTTVRMSRASPTLELWGAGAPASDLRWIRRPEVSGRTIRWMGVPRGCKLTAYVTGSTWGARSEWLADADGQVTILPLQEVPTLVLLPQRSLSMVGAWTVSARQIDASGVPSAPLFVRRTNETPIVIHNFAGHEGMWMSVASTGFSGGVEWDGRRDQTVKLQTSALVKRRVEVVDIDGAPVASVPVTVFGPLLGSLDAVSDAKGQAEFRVWPKDDLVASVVGSRYTSEDVPLSDGSRVTRIVAEPRHRITIVCKLKSPRRLRVSVEPSSGAYERRPFKAQPGTEFKLSGLDARPCVVSVFGMDRGEWRVVATHEFDFGATAPRSEQIVLQDW